MRNHRARVKMRKPKNVDGDFRKPENGLLRLSQSREALEVNKRKIAIERRRGVTDGESI
jgi:hypothetical protein